MKVDVVLISGKMGSGKTTTCRAIINKIRDLQISEWHAKEVIFAGPIYKMHDYCRKVLVESGITPPHAVKDGNLLQLLGTEWGRKTVDENVWAKATRGEIISQATHFARAETEVDRVTFIVPDCRFKNELDIFPEALKVRLECPESTRKKRAEMWRDNSNHPSEVDLDDSLAKFHMVIDTTYITPEEIAGQVIRALLRKRNHSEATSHPRELEF